MAVPFTIDQSSHCRFEYLVAEIEEHGPVLMGSPVGITYKVSLLVHVGHAPRSLCYQRYHESNHEAIQYHKVWESGKHGTHKSEVVKRRFPV